MYVVQSPARSIDYNSYPTIGVFASLNEAKIAAEMEMRRLNEEFGTCDIMFHRLNHYDEGETIGRVKWKSGLLVWSMYTRKSCDYTPITAGFITALANNDPIAHDMLLEIIKS